MGDILSRVWWQHFLLEWKGAAFPAVRWIWNVVPTVIAAAALVFGPQLVGGIVVERLLSLRIELGR